MAQTLNVLKKAGTDSQVTGRPRMAQGLEGSVEGDAK
jgi:hypothetical protein